MRSFERVAESLRIPSTVSPSSSYQQDGQVYEILNILRSCFLTKMPLLRPGMGDISCLGKRVVRRSCLSVRNV